MSPIPGASLTRERHAPRTSGLGESAFLRATSRDDLVPFLFERINPLVEGGETRADVAWRAEA